MIGQGDFLLVSQFWVFHLDSIEKSKYQLANLQVGESCLVLVCLAESDVSAAGGESMAVPVQPRRSGKKLYALLGVVAVVVVVSVVVFMFFLPRGLGEMIPYGFNYAAGEQMTYDISITISGAGQTVSETGTMGMHVLSFDGENYTINETMRLVVQGISQEASCTVKMNKTAYITDISGLPAETQQMYSMFMGMPGFGGFFDKTQARVGETWQVPLNVGNSSFSMAGTINYRFGEIQNITVPAGTYKTFKMEISTNDAHVSSGSVSMSVNMNGQIHMEYGTCRLVDMNMQESMSSSGMGQTTTASVSMQMRLIQDTRP